MSFFLLTGCMGLNAASLAKGLQSLSFYILCSSDKRFGLIRSLLLTLPSTTANTIDLRGRRLGLLLQRSFVLMVLTILMLVTLLANTALAQEPEPDSSVSRKIFIQTASSSVLEVSVGQTITDMAVQRVNPVSDPNVISDAYWVVIPASAARLITPMPAALNSTVEIEFLQAGDATVKVYGYDNFDGQDEIIEPGGNSTEFSVEIEPAPDNAQSPVAENNTGPKPLSANARSALTTVTMACDGFPANVAENTNRTEEEALRATCESLALDDSPAANLERLVPEELFAIGDALANTADHQINNVRTRINNVRIGESSALDFSALELQLWDQKIGGSVLAHGQEALMQGSGGGASQETLSDSSLGVFANGNISVGSVDGKGVQRDASISTDSLMVGADYRINNNSVVGAALGVINNDADFRGDNGKLTMLGINLSAFGTWYEQDKGFADIIMDVSQNDFDLSRRVNLLAQPDEFATSSTDASRITLSANVGRTFQRGATEFGAIARITLTRANIDGFSEASSLGSAGAGTSLKIDSHSMTSARFSVGGEVKHVINTSKAVFVPSLRMEIENESETDKGLITASFINDPDNNRMQLSGTKRDSSAVLVNVGTALVFAHSQSAFVYFETRAQDELLSQNRVRVGYRMHF